MSDTEEPQPLNRLDVLRALHIATWEGIWATVHGVLTGGAFQTGFALMLGASPFELGLLAGLSSVVGLVQLPAAALSERVKERRIFVASMAFPGRILWAFILLIPFVLPRSLWLPAFLVLLMASSALVNAGNPAWTSWMSDLVPPASRGQYFARRNALMGLFTMLVPLPAGAFLDQAVKYHRFAPRIGFATLFAVACAGAVGSLLLLLRQPEPPARRRTASESPLKSLAAPLSNRNFRNFILFAVVIGLGQNIAGQFFTAWQLERHALGLNYLTVQLLGAVAAGSGLLSIPLWGYLSDKYGSRPMLALATAGAVIPPLIWLFTVPSLHAFWLNVALIVLLNLISGACWAAIGLAQFSLLLSLAPASARATYTAVYAAVTGVAGGLSPILGGAVMTALSGISFQAGPVLFNNYKVLFLLAGFIRLSCLLLVGRVKDEEGRSTRYVLEQLVSARPVSSYKSLRRLARPVGEGERRRAVDRLGDIRSPLAVEELTGALDDVSPDIREAAAHALGSIGDARALPALIAKLSDPAAGIGEMAADALGRIGDVAAAESLAEAIRGPDARVRVASLRALIHLSGAASRPAVADALLTSLNPTHPTACEAACATLAAIGASLPDDTARAALPRLLYLLSQEVERGMRLAAARALETLAPKIALEPGVFETVRARLGEEIDSAVLAQEAGVLVKIGTASGQDADTLLAALIPVLRYRAVAGLAYKQALDAVADIGLPTPGSFYPYLGMKEMARDQTFSRLLSELFRKLRSEGTEMPGTFVSELLEPYSRGDYSSCLNRMAESCYDCADSPARSVLRALSASAPDRTVRAEEALLGILLLREGYGSGRSQ